MASTCVLNPSAGWVGISVVDLSEVLVIRVNGVSGNVLMPGVIGPRDDPQVAAVTDGIRSRGTEPVVLLVIDQTAGGEGNTIVQGQK